MNKKEKEVIKEFELIDNSIPLEEFDDDFKNFDQKEFDVIWERCMRNDVERNYLNRDRIES
jgi:hypothetical protein